MQKNSELKYTLQEAKVRLNHNVKKKRYGKQ